jgi:putative tryptophan/tyrosine transport system substrate-binding protein
MMDRRSFLTTVAGLLAAPLTAEAQQTEGKGSRVGVLWPGGSPPRPPRMDAFRQGLRDAGYVEGQNLTIDLRYTDGGVERLAALAAELLTGDVHVIATFGDLAPRAVRQTTRTIPIVALTDDVVGAGLVATLARPGGNTTGITILADELTAKRLELLKQLLPKVSRVAALWDPASGISQVKPMEGAARSLAVQLQVVEVRGPQDLDRAFKAATKARAEAINVMSSPVLASLAKPIIDLAATHHLPAMYQWREAAEAGGLIAYGPSLAGIWRQTGALVGKILKGAKPADLPIEQPATFELVINLKTAKALGVTVPQSLVLRADALIQ